MTLRGGIGALQGSPSFSVEQLGWGRKVVAASSGLFTAILGFAQVAGAPVFAKLLLAGLLVLCAIAILVIHFLERGAGGEAAAGQEPPVPRSRLAGPMEFVNRSDELEKLDALLARSRSAKGPITGVLAGAPGTGKSAVAKHWLEAVRSEFADGDLFGDFSQRRRGARVDVNGVLGEFIRELSPEGMILPPRTAERVDLFRRLSNRRRLLVLLDDVTEPAQVEQLRPTGAGSVVVATTYRELEELHYDGAALVEVDALDDKQAEKMLVQLAGEHGWRFKAEADETKELLGFCGGLALPLCVCGARMLMRGGTLTTAAMVAEISDEERRLQLLAGKGEHAGAAVFGFAYRELGEKARLVYRRLGLHPGVDLFPVHAQLLTDLAADEVGAAIAEVTRAHLLERLDGERCRFHGLVRHHAAERVRQEEDAAAREALQRRLVDWYAAAIGRADRAIIADRLRLAPPGEDPSLPLPELSSREDAFAWLERERPNMLPVLRAARDRGWDTLVWQAAEALWPFHHNRRHYADWIDVTTIGIECARRGQRSDVEARLRAQRSRAFADLGDFDRAREDLAAADRAVRDSANDALRASIQEFTGVCRFAEGDDLGALSAFEGARAGFAAIRRKRGVAIQDYFIGRVLTRQGRPGEAIETLRTALATMESLPDPLFVARLRLRLGQALRAAGDLDRSAAVLEEGIDLASGLGMRLEEAEAHEELAAIAADRGEEREADRHREAALAVYRMIGHPRAGELAAVDPQLGAVVD